MFRNISFAFDRAIDGIALLEDLLKNLVEFVTNLIAVAQNQFECHVRGSPRPPAPYTFISVALINPQTSSQAWKTALKMKLAQGQLVHVNINVIKSLAHTNCPQYKVVKPVNPVKTQ